MNDGAGVFTSHPVTPSFGAGDSLGIDTGDIDGDLDLDVVIANSNGEAETVWLNDGAGSFTAHPTAPSFGAENSFAIALGDIDGDGDLDALVSNGDNQAETVWLNDTAGATTTTTTTSTTSTTLPPSCPETPAEGCAVAARSSLQIKNSDEGGKDQLKWKWSTGTFSYDDLGDPVTASGDALCIYDGVSGTHALAAALVIEPSSLWTTRTSVQWKYKDTEGAQAGVTGVLLKASDSEKAKAQLKAKGVFLGLPLPIGGGEYFDLNPSVIAQLIKNDGPGTEFCLTSDFDLDDASKNEEERFKAAVK